MSPACGGAAPRSGGGPGHTPRRAWRCPSPMWASCCGSATCRTRCRPPSPRSRRVSGAVRPAVPPRQRLPWAGHQHRAEPLPFLCAQLVPRPAGAFHAAVWDFVVIIIVAAPLFALTDYVDSCLGVAWRQWLTQHMIRWAVCGCQPVAPLPALASESCAILQLTAKRLVGAPTPPPTAGPTLPTMPSSASRWTPRQAAHSPSPGRRCMPLHAAVCQLRMCLRICLRI